MTYRAERFNNSMRSLEAMVSGMADASKSAKLLDRKTGEVLATAEVSTVSKGQRATCAFAAVPGGIAKGAYVLEVTTFGLVGETTPRVFRKPVTLVEAIPEPAPVPTRHVAFTGLEATVTEMGNASVLATVDEAEGVLGYEVGEDGISITAFASVNGGAEEEVLLIAPPDGNGFGGVVMGAPSGSRVKLTLKIDPAKTDFDQTPVSREVTVA